MISPAHHIGGLSHLVEAATALSSLVDASAVSHVQVQKERQISDDVDATNRMGSSKTKRREIFPQRLMDILSDSTLTDIISWLPHGRSFVIIRPDIFTEQVLPKYLPPVDARASTKYPSFTRKLNRWGFRQSTRGPDTGAFHHPLFRRDEPELCHKMVCQKSRERKEQKGPSLPPKKRAIHKTKEMDIDGAANVVTQTSCEESTKQAAAATVSSDERSVSSSGNISSNASSSSSDVSESPPASIVSGQSRDSSAIPFISNDKSFVSNVLQRRDHAEILRAAQAMLYDSYIKAVRSGEP